MKKEYLDEKGLATLASCVKASIPKTFVGTLEEWEKLTDSEKDKYDRAEIIDVDDTTIDEDGNSSGNNANCYKPEYISGNWANVPAFTGNYDFSGENVWHDSDGNTYHTKNGNHKQLVDGQWVTKTFSSDILEGKHIWHDSDGNTYYSAKSDRHYKLVDGKWIKISWNYIGISGAEVWHDSDGNTYFGFEYDYGKKLVDGQWIDNYWTNMNGIYDTENVWHDNDGNTHYSSGSYNVKLLNGKWYSEKWNIDIYGKNVWHDDDGNVYYSSGSVQKQLVDGQWVDRTWNMTFDGLYVCNDSDGNTYFLSSYIFRRLEKVERYRYEIDELQTKVNGLLSRVANIESALNA